MLPSSQDLLPFPKMLSPERLVMFRTFRYRTCFSPYRYLRKIQGHDLYPGERQELRTYSLAVTDVSPLVRPGIHPHRRDFPAGRLAGDGCPAT
jgi:hypothetical protein